MTGTAWRLSVEEHIAIKARKQVGITLTVVTAPPQTGLTTHLPSQALESLHEDAGVASSGVGTQHPSFAQDVNRTALLDENWEMAIGALLPLSQLDSSPTPAQSPPRHVPNLLYSDLLCSFVLVAERRSTRAAPHVVRPMAYTPQLQYAFPLESFSYSVELGDLVVIVSVLPPHIFDGPCYDPTFDPESTTSKVRGGADQETPGSGFPLDFDAMHLPSILFPLPPFDILVLCLLEFTAVEPERNPSRFPHSDVAVHICAKKSTSAQEMIEVPDLLVLRLSRPG
ncbi:hypothetical protein CVT26_011345 [Gymnopilus dilepis]|uniref:Uncharacterized protein n=1 Tax=Gymnopilus dilepis TaxID=231916 RepID=A0A409YHB2_9AGAR|nr:hypothetical protein CVT26_011345 [Gymnopilus dilepis]